MKYTLFFYLLVTGSIGCSVYDSNQITNAENDKPLSIDQQMSNEESELFHLLAAKDSILFSRGFNHCDTASLRKVTSFDLEFYHDQVGVMNSQEEFLTSISGLCNMPYRATRELVPNSLSIHLLKNNGAVYGVIQNRKHRFLGEEENKSKYLTSTADFTHLWILENEEWRVKRILSFNHQVPNDH